MNICYIIIGILLLFACFDLMIGVSNDTVNFLNSSIGSKAAPFVIIMIVANIFKVLRLLQKTDSQVSYNYYQIIRRLQKLSDAAPSDCI